MTNQPTPNYSKTVWKLVGVVSFMLALGFASVPLYDLFCRVTGFGGTTSVSETGSDVILDQTILIRFDASLDHNMEWEFEAPSEPMEIRIGETGMAFYTAYNPTDRPIAGTAAYNVTPYVAGGYFSKIACFCFTEQILDPGERVEMPVTFYVDPAIVDDPEASHIPAITLSYTFYETDLPEDEYAALDGDSE
ncbi:cytochrome c oxidase assembly protein [Nioella ostreopsis]|jgi:cytochrome c oxidase assembly protein subunit 11|uniref:cytochrome c oxidase assembly protein n=1 Tax=Nioella ostreopsis TaxID=2448479 RepID=UPI000FD950A7|nr:cytochrome c oxidase assembly protein [Nioella ostreopsis]